MSVLCECEPTEPLGVERLREAGLDLVLAEARRQEENFLGGCPSTDAAGVELFRRAVEQQDELAWAGVLELYRPLLAAQTSRALIRGLVREDDQFCIDRAFERFWRATRSSGLAQFPDLASILKYLKLCLASVLLDEARQRRRQPAMSLALVDPDASLSEDPAAEATAATSRSELWQAVQHELKTDRERLVARLSFSRGLTPRQIFAHKSGSFRDVAEIYRIKRNIVERLRHSAAISELRG